MREQVAELTFIPANSEPAFKQTTLNPNRLFWDDRRLADLRVRILRLLLYEFFPGGCLDPRIHPDKIAPQTDPEFNRL